MRQKSNRSWRWALAAFTLLALLSVAVLADEIANSNENKPVERIPEFIASKDWKELLPGQGVPAVGSICRLSIACEAVTDMTWLYCRDFTFV